MKALTVNDLKLSTENLALLTALTGNSGIINENAGAAFNQACKLTQEMTEYNKVSRLPGIIALGISLNR